MIKVLLTFKKWMYLIFVKHLKKKQKYIEKFKETLSPDSADNDDNENNYNLFINTIFFAIRLNVEQKTDLCSLAELKKSVDNNLFIQHSQEKFNIILVY